MRKRQRFESRIISDVNITPLVDTCLVLLIMFMIATPILVTQAIPVNLPRSSKGVSVSTQNELFVTVNFDAKDGVKYYFLQNKNPISLDELGVQLAKKINTEKRETVFIYSDGNAPMEKVISLADVITSKGGRVSIVTQQGK
jgi:biopolymer transport protein TolR